MAFSWTAPLDVTRERQIPADRPVYFVSDLHLGDGTRSDIFMHKDRLLLELLARCRDEGARLVVVGDAIDFHQAWSLTRVIRAHGQLLRAFSDLADKNGVFYIYGNHDHDIALYHELFRWDVCARLRIGADIVVQHGHQFDPFIGADMAQSSLMTRLHHLVERLTGIWIRMPLHEFYTPGNRLVYWLFHKAWMLGKARNLVYRQLGLHALADKAEKFSTYWARSEAGDPMEMLFPTLAAAKQLGATTMVCGHAHMPGNVMHEGVRYVNTGSWTYAWSQYAYFDGDRFLVRDWGSGREFGDELYRPALDGVLSQLTFDRWWNNQYLGWFRYRSAELRRQAS